MASENISSTAVSPKVETDSQVRHFVFASPAILVLALALCGVGVWGLQTNILGLFHDDGVYAVVAKAISEGEGHRITSLPTSPPQTKYPFLYSYILSWVWSVDPHFPENIIWLKGVNVVCLFFIVLLSYYFYNQNVSRNRIEALVYAFLVGANPAVFTYIDYTVSDLLLLALALLAFCLYGRQDSEWFNRSGAAVLALIVSLAILTRSAGVPLFLAGAVHYLWLRRFREMVFYLATVGFLACPWFLWQIGHRSAVSPDSLLWYYVGYDFRGSPFLIMWNDPANAAEIVWANLRYFLDSFDVIWLMPAFPALHLWLIVYAFVVIGVATSLRSQSIFLYAFLVLYLFLIWGWPFHPLRYTLPIIPLILLFLFRGLRVAGTGLNRLARAGEEGYPRLLAWLPLMAIVSLNIAWLVSTVQTVKGSMIRGSYGVRLDSSWQGYEETFDWIRNHTDKRDILATTFDPMYYLYTGRKAVIPAFHRPETYFYPYKNPSPEVGKVEQVKRELAALGARYLIVNPQEQFAEREAVAALMEGLLRSYSVEPTLLFTSTDSLHKVYRIPSHLSNRHD